MSTTLTAADFPAFYRALHKGHDPFPWQERLAKIVCSGDWPKSLELPTASGKTSCIDIAVFAMAMRGSGPRRVFFVIDRRVVVDQAFEHMKEIAAKLKHPKEEILQRVAERLRQMGGTQDEPLAVYQMRGGIYRDDSWVRSPMQPMLFASTVDQVGSRILFRGYGASEKAWPIHAALVANDSLILLDEAHCSGAFAQTLARIEEYRGGGWSGQDIGTPFAFVEMTATPVRSTTERFQLDEADYSHPVLKQRLFAPKPARLVVSKARLKDTGKFAETLVAEAIELSKQSGLHRIAVIVNRVRTARLVYQSLRDGGLRSHLLIGRMRPIDRARLDPGFEAMHSGRERNNEGPVFVVATQCLEVGADLDFDGLVTECASIDALLQRFGRLDRTGELHSRGIRAEGRIVASTPMTDKKYNDAVYAGALSKTWKWLASGGESADFAICSEAGNTTVRERLSETRNELRRESAPAPLLLPAHLDAFVQTSPTPALDPDPHVFLHGKENGLPEVQVVWRADLDLAKRKQLGGHPCIVSAGIARSHASAVS